jgi:hypothetical protein
MENPRANTSPELEDEKKTSIIVIKQNATSYRLDTRHIPVPHYPEPLFAPPSTNRRRILLYLKQAHGEFLAFLVHDLEKVLVSLSRMWTRIFRQRV